VFSDNGVTAINQLTSPITTDINGAYQFYAPNGRYDLVIAATGITTITKSDIIVDDLVTFVGGNYANNTGTSNGLVAALPSAPQSGLVDGYPLTLDMGGVTNAAGAVTLQVTLNGTITPAYPVTKSSGLGFTPLIATDLPQRALFSFDSPTSSWVLLNPTDDQILTNYVAGTALVSAVVTTVNQLTLSPGTWDVTGTVSFLVAIGGTAYTWVTGLSTATATFQSNISLDLLPSPGVVNGGGTVKVQTTPPRRLTVAPGATQIIYLVAQQGLAAGTGSCTSTLEARLAAS
jgi:hypothetical protein